MKSSNYNICLPFEDGYIIFNSITRRFFRVSDRNKDAFLEILSSPDRFSDKYESFLKKMKTEGFIVDDEKNEMDDVKLLFDRQNNSNVYKLMILPTYQCNLRCWYCTQEHRNMRLAKDDVDSIKRHISYYIEHHPVRQLMLSWFGGEPLLEFSIVEEISRYAMKCCEGLGLEFRNTITTNGTLLSRERLQKMKELDFTFFQITIDGAQEEHDQTKVLKGRSSYEVILKNICLIAEMLPEAEICLRYNYTLKNLQPERFVGDMNKFIPFELRKSIHLSLMKVWQEDERLFDHSIIESLMILLENNSYQINTYDGFNPCCVEQKHFNCIFPDGFVDKCSNDELNSRRGFISLSGDIKWNKELLFRNNTVFNNQTCSCYQCEFLPICYGPCPHERDMWESLHCRYRNPKQHWKQEILDFIRVRTNN